MRAPDLQRNGSLAGAFAAATPSSLSQPAIGGLVRAWKVVPTPGQKNYETGVGSWIVNGPFHPLWTWWYLGVTRLRDFPGVPPAHKQYPEAEYEFLILSLSPDHEVDIDRLDSGEDTIQYLTPADAVIQFHGLQDVDAERVLDLAAKVIVDGRASPDSDWRSWWEQCIPNTVEHVRRDVMGLSAPEGHDGG